MTKEQVAVISFGLAGHSMTMPGSVLSGYEKPETFERRLAAGAYANYQIDGALVIDKTPALETRPFLAYQSPLVSANLTGASVNTCPQPDPLFTAAVLEDPGNAFAGLLALQTCHQITNPEPGPLDFVSPVAYAEWWRDHGARIGRMNGQRIEWEVDTPQEGAL